MDDLEERLEIAWDTLEKRLDRLEERLEANSREAREGLRNLQVTLIVGFFAVLVALIALL